VPRETELRPKGGLGGQVPGEFAEDDFPELRA